MCSVVFFLYRSLYTCVNFCIANIVVFTNGLFYLKGRYSSTSTVFHFAHCRHIATSCYSGEVKLWSGEGWRCEDVTQAPIGQQHHVSCMSTTIAFNMILLGMYDQSPAHYAYCTINTVESFCEAHTLHSV